MREGALTPLAVVLTLAVAGCGDDGEEDTTAPNPEAGTATTGSQGVESVPQGNETVPAEPPPADEPEQTGNGQVLRTTARNTPEDALREALASGDPRLACEEAVTEAYVSEAYGSAQGCRAAQAGKGVATKVRLVEATLETSRGKGTVRFQGGTYDREEGKVGLVLEDDRWKLDSLEVDVPAGP